MSRAPAITVVLVVALGSLSATAQAAKYYRSGALIAEGEKVPIIEWGTLRWFCVTDCGPEKPCEYIAAGLVTNGAETGEGATASFAAYDCVDARCPPGKITVKGGEYEKELTVVATNLPWPNILIEEAGIRVNYSTGVQLLIGCVAHGLSNTSPPGGTDPGEPGAQEQFYLASPRVCVTAPEGPGPLFRNGKGRPHGGVAGPCRLRSGRGVR